jgi:O-antigen ligase
VRQNLLKSIDISRGLLILGASLGSALWLDPLSADPSAPKTFCLSVASVLLAGLTALKLWWGGRLALPKGQLAWAGSALFAAVSVAFLFSQSQARSESSFNAWCLLFLLGISAFDWLQEASRQRQLLEFFGICLGLACAWALLQALGVQVDAADAAARAAFGARLSSRLGNPNFFGGFLLLTLPAALWLKLNAHKAWGLLLLVACLLLLLSGSKAAWAGFGFQYFALGHLQWHSTRPLAERKIFLRRWAGAGLLIAALGLGLMPQSTRARLLGALDPSSESIQFRLRTWEGGLKAFAARPLLGHGPGSFSAVYPAYRPTVAMQGQLQHSYEVTHAENWPLQIAVEYGLLGLAALLAFFYLMGRPLWSLAHGQGADADLNRCLVLALGGSLIGNLAGLDLFLPSSFWFFTLLSALAMARLSPRLVLGINAEPYAALALSLCILLACLIGSSEAMARFKSQRALGEAEKRSQAGDFGGAIQAYQQALQGDPANTEALYFLGASQLDSGQPQEALKTFESLQALAPDYVLVHDKKARAFNAMGKIKEAAFEWERQVKLDPWFLPGIQGLASAYAGLGRLAEATRLLESAQARFPGREDLLSNLELLKRAGHGRSK